MRRSIKFVQILLCAVVSLSFFSVSAHSFSDNKTRLRQLIDKGKKHQSIVIGVIGGSITQGAWAQNPENRWPNVFARWWSNKFECEVTLVNAGIGQTGSDIGCLRIQSHLLRYNPDLIILEFAVNDTPIPNATETYEGIVRKILNNSDHTAVCALFTSNRLLQNVEGLQHNICEYYRIPWVSIKPSFAKAQSTIQDFWADSIHPNDRGHILLATLLSQLVDSHEKQWEQVATASSESPAPLSANLFETSLFLNADLTDPFSMPKWTRFGPGAKVFFGNGWQTSARSTLVLEGTGKQIGFLYNCQPGVMGKASICVDGSLTAPIDASIRREGIYSYLSPVLPIGRHQIKIDILPNTINGSCSFQILGLLTTGTPAEMVRNQETKQQFTLTDITTKYFRGQKMEVLPTPMPTPTPSTQIIPLRIFKSLTRRLVQLFR